MDQSIIYMILSRCWVKHVMIVVVTFVDQSTRIYKSMDCHSQSLAHYIIQLFDMNRHHRSTKWLHWSYTTNRTQLQGKCRVVAYLVSKLEGPLGTCTQLVTANLTLHIKVLAIKSYFQNRRPLPRNAQFWRPFEASFSFPFSFVSA